MTEVWALLQDNVAMAAILGVFVAIVFQLLKRVSWLEKYTGSAAATIWKGRVTSLLVSIVATVGALAASGEWAGLWPALVVGFQTWLVAQGFWAGILRGFKA